MTDPAGLLVRYRPKLLAYLLHLTGDLHESEDVLQELSVAVLEKPDMLTRAGDVFAYLRGVARHLAAGRHGGRIRAGEALRRWTEWAWEADPDDGTTDDDRERQVRALRLCRESLRDDVRRLVALRYDRGLDLDAISRAIGSRVGAVKVALLRARRALARCVQGRLAREGRT